jgi:hypothetical protein
LVYISKCILNAFLGQLNKIIEERLVMVAPPVIPTNWEAEIRTSPGTGEREEVTKTL